MSAGTVERKNLATAEPREVLAARRRRRHAERLTAAAATLGPPETEQPDAAIGRCGGCGQRLIVGTECSACFALARTAQAAERARDADSAAAYRREMIALAEIHRRGAAKITPEERALRELDAQIGRCGECGLPYMRGPAARVEHRCDVCPEQHPRVGARCTLPRGHDDEEHVLGQYGKVSAWRTSC